MHERARQGRLRAKLMQDISAQEERERGRKANPRAQLSRDAAAVRIQKLVRGYFTRLRVAKVRGQTGFLTYEWTNDGICHCGADDCGGR